MSTASRESSESGATTGRRADDSVAGLAFEAAGIPAAVAAALFRTSVLIKLYDSLRCVFTVYQIHASY